MHKNEAKTKISAILAASALLTMGAAFTSMAAWEQSGSSWIFTDNSGNRVRDSWRQSGNDWYYLDHNGIMATNRWVDDTYYVDGNGVRVVRDGWRTINNQRYHFNYDGTMQYGWTTLVTGMTARLRLAGCAWIMMNTAVRKMDACLQ